MTDSTPAFSWRSIVLPAYLPTLLFSLGEGAIIPVIPVVATDRGASIALAGLVAAMLMIGQLLGDLPAGWLVARIGERNAMIGASMLAIIGMVVAVALPSVAALAVGVLLLGLSTAVFGLARHAFLTTFVPVRVRARALSTLAGVFRGGWAVGPFVAAAIIAATGSSELVLWVLVGACIAVIVVLVLLPDPERVFGTGRAAGGGEAPQGVLRTIGEHRGVLARIGTGIGLLAAIRASRTIILPLWAVSIGMAPEAAAIVIGISATIDFCLFYVSGQVMDRFGRLWSAIPGLVGLSAGHLILAFTHDAPANEAWFTFVAVLFGIANGLSSGVLMTLGSDLAPKRHPSAFLAAYRTIADTGQATAPLVISGMTVLASLAAASATMGVLGLVGAAMLLRWVPRYLPNRRPDA